MQYNILLRILDQIRFEAPAQLISKYQPIESDVEKVNQARSRAYIHLYLKVMFGIFDFTTREKTITDKGYDGGIDGYYIDEEARNIYFIQSKFRTTEKNFETKTIELEEILAMDLDRILNGETTDEAGNKYNGKIKQLQREISNLSDIARFSYKVVLLANITKISSNNLRKITSGYSSEILNFEKSYERLVFPVISGTYFTASDITIPIDLSRKNAGSKISYTVSTKGGECEITVLFAPTIEIAKVMHKYKNSILKYNPRSFLELDGKSVNAAIRDTILNNETNEFALFNNGITLLSDETNINERIGQKNKAQLRIKNPQIINGGQTSFALSRIYGENIADSEKIFADKEVLVKIITLLDGGTNEIKLGLIDEISNATNKQTPVINADRFANEVFHTNIQKKLFTRYGLLYERKRGEFADGVKDGYIDAEQVIERNLLWRLFYTANGNITKGLQKRLFQRDDFDDVLVCDDKSFDKLYIAVIVFGLLKNNFHSGVRVDKTINGKIYAYVEMFFHMGVNLESEKIQKNFYEMEFYWDKFLRVIRESKEKIKVNPGQNFEDVRHEQFWRDISQELPKGLNFEKELIDFFKDRIDGVFKF